MNALDGKVVVVTGAAQGFGRSIALACAGAGAMVTACDISDCDETVDIVKAAGGNAISVRLNIVDIVACRSVAGSVTDRFGRIDGLVNNAALYGSLTWAPFDQISEDEWDRCLTTNVTGTWNMCRAVAPAMRRVSSGSIVNIASNTALIGPALTSHYVTSKAAVLGLTRALATELGTHGVRVNSLCPGGMDTPGTHKSLVGVDTARIMSTLPPSRMEGFLKPEDVVGSIVFLVSDASRYLTGQTIAVDGGMTSN